MTAFDAVLAEALAASPGGRLSHRAHLHLTWLAVSRCGVPDATALIADGLRRTTRYAGAPQKYHATVSRAWVELVGHHAAERPDPSVGAFTGRVPDLLDKRLLTRFYRPATFASASARTGWVEPDLAPFPSDQVPSDQIRSRPIGSRPIGSRPIRSGQISEVSGTSASARTSRARCDWSA